MLIWQLFRIKKHIILNLILLQNDKGQIFVTYNMGGITHPVLLPEQVSDGRYHVLRFTRAGSNCTLEVDDNMQYKSPISKYHTKPYLALEYV